MRLSCCCAHGGRLPLLDPLPPFPAAALLHVAGERGAAASALGAPPPGHARASAPPQARAPAPQPPWPRSSRAVVPAGHRRQEPPPRAHLAARRPWPRRTEQVKQGRRGGKLGAGLPLTCGTQLSGPPQCFLFWLFGLKSSKNRRKMQKNANNANQILLVFLSPDLQKKNTGAGEISLYPC